MRIYTSYFYQIRFFPPNLVPLSTAIWDPKWFHDNKSQSYQFKDKRGVLNGLRAEIFNPEIHGNGQCRGPEMCIYTGDKRMCPFLLGYRIQLNKLNFQNVIERFQLLHDTICAKEHLEDCDFALIVHEAPTNPCSERDPIQQWFADNGQPIEEWYPLFQSL